MSSVGQSVVSRDHPRTRGDHVALSTTRRQHLGPPPHPRGPLVAADAARGAQGTTPAPAGTTPRPSALSRTPRDHPRTRGDHAWRPSAVRSAGGPPPHPRGPPRRLQAAVRRSGTTPAPAGTTPNPAPRPRPRWDHPRTRGDHPAHLAGVAPSPGPPPHPRGPQALTWPFNQQRGRFYSLPQIPTYPPPPHLADNEESAPPHNPPPARHLALLPPPILPPLGRLAPALAWNIRRRPIRCPWRRALSLRGRAVDQCQALVVGGVP